MEQFRIEGLEVNQIGPFEYLKLNFPKKQDPEKAEIHIFTGENGTGKTTLLQLLNIFPIGTSYIDKKKWNSTISNFWVQYSDNEPNDFLNNKISPRKTKWGSVFLNQSEPSDIAFFYYTGYRKINNSNIDSISELRYTHNNNKYNPVVGSSEPEMFLRWVANLKSSEGIYFLRGEHEKAKLCRDKIERIQDVISKITNLQLEFELEIEPKIKVLLKINGQSLDFDNIPDGIKSIVTWVSDLLMRLQEIEWKDNTPIFNKNVILFLDEIEVHLHPAWQRKILPVVQKLFKNAQIFVSTHSPFVVGSVDGAWVYRFDKTGQYATLAEGFPLLSEDAKSYDYILEEVFGIKERFGIEVEKKLAEFKLLKNQLLRDEPIDEANFRTLVHELASQSTEIESIIGMELRQLKRITNKDFWELTTA